MSRFFFSRCLKAGFCFLISCILLPGITVFNTSLAEVVSDFDYAFQQNYVDQKWAQEDPKRQVSTAEFKSMLIHMIESTVPDQLSWFNSKVSDDVFPASREVGTLMSWYAAVVLGQDDYNSGFDVTAVFNDTYNEDDETLNKMFALLPEAWIQTTVNVPNWDHTWELEHGAAVAWNVSHISSRTGSQTIPFDEEKGTMHFTEPLTVFDAISAVSRLWDSYAAGAGSAVSTASINDLPVHRRDEIVTVNYPHQDVLIRRATDMRKRLKDRQSEDLRKALEMGIVSEELLAHADEPASERETARMVQAALKAGPGLESKFLSAVINDQDDPHLEDSATRFWFCLMVGYTYDEWYSHRDCDGNWKAFLDTIVLADGFFDTIASGPPGIYVDNPESYIQDNYIGRIGIAHSIEDICLDVGSWIAEPSADQIPYHNSSVEPMFPIIKTASLYDRTTGDKVLMDYGDGSFRPFVQMTVADAATAALRYARSFEEKPELVSWEDAGNFNPEIITEELLQKKTTLPYNDCKNLPSSWHGMMLGKLSQLNNLALGNDMDHTVYPEDIDIFKSAGINFIRLGLSFSRLQGQNGIGEEGKVNLTRLDELDQVLAWCMERDIHLDLAASDLPDNYQQWGTGGENFFSWSDKMGHGPRSDAEIGNFAAFWGMLARRYADIPNEYLSFNIQNEPYIESEEEYLRIYGPAVEAIRKYSPNRTIIADIHNPGTITGESMASLGIALSAHFYEPIGFIRTEPWQPGDFTEEHVTNIQWPGENEDIRHYFAGEETPWIVPYNTVKATAEKYGVGFMVGEFGILILDEVTGGYPSYRYSDEAIYGYYSDVLNAFREDETPWCFGISNSPYGLFQLLPIYDTEYERVGYYYVDTKMRDFLKSYQSGQ